MGTRIEYFTLDGGNEKQNHVEELPAGGEFLIPDVIIDNEPFYVQISDKEKDGVEISIFNPDTGEKAPLIGKTVLNFPYSYKDFTIGSTDSEGSLIMKENIPTVEMHARVRYVPSEENDIETKQVYPFNLN